MINLLAFATYWWGLFAGNALIYVLPMTGGDGPILVTIIGISLAGLSLIMLFLRMRSGRKNKNKVKNQ